jgi:anaerobic magnesium-protoporphyrin IX monomethyl ester cyclase
VVHGMIGVPARWRLDHDFYSYPFELWLKDLVSARLAPPKSKVDAHQLEAEVVTC